MLARAVGKKCLMNVEAIVEASSAQVFIRGAVQITFLASFRTFFAATVFAKNVMLVAMLASHLIFCPAASRAIRLWTFHTNIIFIFVKTVITPMIALHFPITISYAGPAMYTTIHAFTPDQIRE